MKQNSTIQMLNNEVKLTNRRSAFLRTTSAFCNTRKQQGLFGCKVESLNNSLYLLLSSLDETIEQSNCSYKLACHKYPGVYYPEGNNYICDTTQAPYLNWMYCMGPLKLKKEILLVEDAQQLIISYTLLESNSAVNIDFQPLLAFREINAVLKAGCDINYKSAKIANGLKVKMNNNLPWLHIQFSKSVAYVNQPDWYYNFEYIDKGIESNKIYEDLYTPGHFATTMESGERFFVSIGLDEVSPLNIRKTFIQELNSILNMEVKRIETTRKRTLSKFMQFA